MPIQYARALFPRPPRRTAIHLRPYCWALVGPLLSILPSQNPRSTSPRAHCTSATSPPPSPNRIFLPTPAHTYDLGRLLALDARPGDVLLLSGALGAGKTALARGYVQCARDDRSLDVTSPTYLLANSYPAQRGDSKPTVVHMDLWRLNDASERPIVDFDHVFTRFASLVEWPDRLGEISVGDRLQVLLEYPEVPETDEDDPWGFGSGDPDDVGAAMDGRFVSFVPHGERWTRRVEELYQEYVRLDQQGRTTVVAG